MMDLNKASEAEVAAAEKIVQRESKDIANWKVHIMCLLMISVAFVANLLRGTSKNPSVINIQKCGGLDWFIFFSVIIISILVCVVQVYRVQAE